jgi:uncharacterized membrane protein YeiH
MEWLLRATELGFSASSFIGTVAFALSGFLMGVRSRLDIMGIFIVSALPAAGGGVVRDVLVGRVPNLLVNIEPVLLITGTILVAFLFKLHQKADLERKMLFVVSDSLGLVAFSISGALVGIEAGLSVFGVIILAFITAVGGGIIRDVLVNNVPMILRGGFYGSVAVLVAATLYFLNIAGYNNLFTSLGLLIYGLTLRLLAYFRHWELPRVHYEE